MGQDFMLELINYLKGDEIMKYINDFTVVVGVVMGAVAGALGGWDATIKTLIVLIVLDYATGIIKAIYNRALSSEIGFKGICKKVVMLISVAAINSLQNGLGIYSIPVREIFVMFLACNEGISLLENAVDLGVPVPKKIVDKLVQVRDDLFDKEEDVDEDGDGDTEETINN